VKLLNQNNTMTGRFYGAKPDSIAIEIRGKHFVYDKNSMNVWELDGLDVDSKPLLSNQGPQFNQQPITKVRCLVFEATHKCNIACKYCFVTQFYEDQLSESDQDAGRCRADS
jgi:sulfatase maturation enzyme AslB (radical SAM superfamily)